MEAPVENDTRPVRAGEEVDLTRLVARLREQLPQCLIPAQSGPFDAGIDAASLSIPPVLTQFPGGHSNLTYLLQFGDLEVVVRELRHHGRNREARGADSCVEGS